MFPEKPYESLKTAQKVEKFGNPVPSGHKDSETTFVPPAEFKERLTSFRIDVAGRKMWVTVNKAVEKQWKAFLRECEPYILTYDGSFVPRLVRGTIVGTPSSHAFGTALDFNAQWNPLGASPRQGATGSVENMIPIAMKYRMFCGGWFKRLDWMHFESTMTDQELESTGVTFEEEK